MEVHNCCYFPYSQSLFTQTIIADLRLKEKSLTEMVASQQAAAAAQEVSPATPKHGTVATGCFLSILL